MLTSDETAILQGEVSPVAFFLILSTKGLHAVLQEERNLVSLSHCLFLRVTEARHLLATDNRFAIWASSFQNSCWAMTD